MWSLSITCMIEGPFGGQQCSFESQCPTLSYMVELQCHTCDVTSISSWVTLSFSMSSMGSILQLFSRENLLPTVPLMLLV